MFRAPSEKRSNHVFGKTISFPSKPFPNKTRSQLSKGHILLGVSPNGKAPGDPKE